MFSKVKNILSEFKFLYLNKKMFTILALGYGSGIPFTLIFITYTFKLAEAGVNLRDIGLFGLAGLPFTIKFLWAPLVDGLKIPFLHKLGQRKSWLILSQLAVMAIIFKFAFLDPNAQLMSVVYLAILLAFASATYDIAIDAIRVEMIELDKQGAAAGSYIMGYRIGMLVAGGVSLIVADIYSWSAAFFVIGGTLIFSIIATLLAKEPQKQLATHQEGKIGWGVWFSHYVAQPFAQFVSKHRNWVVILLFAVFYKIGDSLLSKMMHPFYLDMGFTKTEVAEITKFYGFVMTVVGGMIGGWTVYKIGIMRSLLIFGVLQMLSNLAFVWQANVGHDTSVLTVVITLENMTGAMGTAAFVAFFSYLCDVRYTATQYAILTSFMSLGRWITNAPAGYMVDAQYGLGLAWSEFFWISTLIAIPPLFLIKHLKINEVRGARYNTQDDD